MNSLPSIALSGMNTALLDASVAAHNIANAQTPNFHRQQLVRQTQNGGGVTASVTQAPDPGNSLADDMVQQMQAVYSFKANLKTVQVADKMLGSLLDLLA